MLKVYIHSGTLGTRSLGNQLAIVDIAYAKRHYLADYAVAMTMKGAGEVKPDMVTNYPRWSGSVWDLVARALTRILYRGDTCPPTKYVDRRCAVLGSVRPRHAWQATCAGSSADSRNRGHPSLRHRGAARARAHGVQSFSRAARFSLAAGPNAHARRLLPLPGAGLI